MEFDFDFSGLALGSSIAVPDDSFDGAVIVAQQTHSAAKHGVNEDRLRQPVGGCCIRQRDWVIGPNHMGYTEYLEQFFRLAGNRRVGDS